MFPIFPQDFAENFFGPSPPSPPYEVANAESQTTDDLNALRYGAISILPPVGSGAILPNSSSPFMTLFPS